VNKILIEEIEKIFNDKKFNEVIEKLLPLIKSTENNKQTDIPIWNIYYLIGQSYRFKEDYKNASSYLKKSVETYENPSNLKALGIVYHQVGSYNEAIKLHTKSLGLDDTQPSTWNSIGISQKYLKQYDKAEINYETAINVHLKNIVKSLNNSKNSVFYPHSDDMFKAPLFTKYAMDAAIFLTVKKNYDSISYPSGAAAEAITVDESRKSLYWSEQITKDEKKTFLIMPNFFNTLFYSLFKNKTYFMLIGNKAEVLELQEKEDEAKKYWTEANLFKSLFETYSI
jgi:tetratricopeptide (TPR) repeat protein